MKRKGLNILFLFLLLVAGYGSLFAQHFTASVSKATVGTGEQFEVSFSIDANASGFEAPAFSGFDIYSGPNESTSVQFINGNVSQSVTFSYILAGKTEGTYTLGPATIHVGGKTLTSNTVSVKVVKGVAPQASSPAGSQGSGTGGSLSPADLKKIFLLR